MGINRDFLTSKEAIMWNEQEVATIRALSPQDIGVVLMQGGDLITGLFLDFDKADLKNLVSGDPEQVADRVMAIAPRLMSGLALKAPDLLALIIAVASDESDLESAVSFIMAEWPAPLQLHYLSKLARISFNDVEGFKEFVGNVAALVSTVEVLTSARPLKISDVHVPNDSDAG